MKFSTNIKKYDDVSTLGDDDLICYCCDVDKKTILDAIHNGSSTLKEIKITTRACTGDECATLNPNKRCCSKEIKQLIRMDNNLITNWR
jgi:NAD(P)H-nitrite reductase large subunit